jgi:uncharacterized protein (TIGR02271 family)
MDNSNGPAVVGEQGLHGRLLTGDGTREIDGENVTVELDGGRTIHVPASVLVRRPDGSYYLPLSADDLGAADNQPDAHVRRETALVVPVVREEFSVEKRPVEIGRARITKRVEERTEILDEPLMREEVQIDRVPINRAWEGPPPPPRYEADKLIIPLLEETLVVEKRLMLKEELHISRVRKTVREPQDVVLRSESVTVERIEPEPGQPSEPHGGER